MLIFGGWPCVLDGLLDHRVEGRIEQHLDQAGGGVIAAGGLALVAGSRGQLEGAGIAVEERVQLEQRFVHAAQLFRSQVLVIHRPPAAAFNGEGQRTDGVQQRLVVHLAGFQVGQGFVGEEEAVQNGQA